MEIGLHQDVIGIRVAAHESLSYDDLSCVAKTADFAALLKKNEFSVSIIGREANFDTLQAIADMCNMKAREVKPGDLGVIFRRLPLIEADEAAFLSLRDIADKFVAAVDVYVAERDKAKISKPAVAA